MMGNRDRAYKENGITKARFETACALIYLDFQNAPNPQNRRCVRRITSWDKVYFVEFYWGRATFLSKRKYSSHNKDSPDDVGLSNEFPDPTSISQRSLQRNRSKDQSGSRWSKKHHQAWILDRKLEVDLFLAREKYRNSGESEDLIELKAYCDLLGIEPFSTPEVVKHAYRQKAKVFHPDLGGNEKQFDLLQRAYKIVLEASSNAFNTFEIEDGLVPVGRSINA